MTKPPTLSAEQRRALAAMKAGAEADKAATQHFTEPPIKVGSISKMHDFEKCPFMAFLKHVKRVELPQELREKLQFYADRGTRIHQAAEDYISKKTDQLIPELKHFRTELELLRSLYPRKVKLEEEWALDRNWQPTAWNGPDTWIRMKLDVSVDMSKDEVLVGDWKSGRKFGNEVKHNEQGQLYAIAANAYHPEATTTYVEFYYTDQDEMTQVEYGKRHLEQFKRSLGARMHKLTSATAFPPKPNIFNCQNCAFNVNGTGHCERGISDVPPRRTKK